MEERKRISEPETVKEAENEVADGNATKKQRTDIILNFKVRDSSGKAIFADDELCAQFVRDYVDIPELKHVTAEDIEDVSSQFVPLFAEERNADRAKRIQLKKEKNGKKGAVEPPYFLVSLIEHKTQVEYNVCMQIFRYMVYIWDAYEKDMEMLHPRISKRKDFCYPAILPIVYYEGADEWTASVNFKDRVSKSDVFGEYIPNFKYYLVPVRKYSNAELLRKEDEISLIMMFNKIQTKEDVGLFLDEVSGDAMQKILKDTPDHIVNLIADIYLAFQLKANIPPDEAEVNAGKVRKKKVAELFEHATFGDLYADSQRIKKQIEGQKKQLAEQDKQLEESE